MRARAKATSKVTIVMANRAKKKVAPTKRMEALIKECRELTVEKGKADDLCRRQYRYDELSSPLPQRKSRTNKRRRANNNAELFSEAILIGSKDLELRSIEPHECRIDRVAWFQNTRFYPFFKEANADHVKFYKTPTTLCCVWCTEPCNSVPIPIPHRYSPPTKTFSVSGQFCSFECMLGEAKERGCFHLRII